MKPTQHPVTRQGIWITLALAATFALASSASADLGKYGSYLEECQNEGCDTEEVEELYEWYEEECLHEGCSFEEIIELAGHPSSVSAMLNDFRNRGWKVDDKHLLAAQCTPVGSETKCALVVLLCRDLYQCPGGDPLGPPTKSAWYACGVCFGSDGC